MFEYLTMMGGTLQGVWMGQVTPFFDSLRGSPFFWPGVVVAVLVLLMVARTFVK